jgi:hypothetical protein
MSDNAEEPRGGPEGLEPDPLAERLTPDGAVMLEGILGKGPTDDVWHLFLDRELTRRAEFKASDVIHSEKIREEDPPFLGTQSTRVYLRRGARVVYTTTRSREVQAEFLRGDIEARVTAEAAGARLSGALEWPRLETHLMCGSIHYCPSLKAPGAACQTHEVGDCVPPRTWNPLCNTADMLCSALCPTAWLLCS